MNKEKKARTVVGIIDKYKRINQIDDEELAIRAHFSIATLYNRKKSPEKLTLEEWWRLCEFLNVSKEDKQEVM